MQRDLLAAYPDAPFQVYVLWMPVLGRDRRDSWDPALIDDRRATHYWDAGAKVGRWLHGFAPFWDHPDPMAWDIGAVYGPTSVWPTDGPPTALLAYAWTVTDDRAVLLRAIEPRLRGPWFRAVLPVALR